MLRDSESTVLIGITSERDGVLPSQHLLSLYAKIELNLKGLEDGGSDKFENKWTTSSSEGYRAA